MSWQRLPENPYCLRLMTLDKQIFNWLRKRAVGGGRRHTLKTPTDKLFFILFYLKCYPTFDLAGLLYGVDRA